MHWFGLLIISADTEDAESKVPELLAPFTRDLEVNLQKEYFHFRLVNNWKKYLATDDPAVVVEYLVSRTPFSIMGEEIGFDKQGIYRITTHNSDSHWDYWHYRHGDYMLGETRFKQCLDEHNAVVGTKEPIYCNMCVVAELLKDIYPLSIITPDGIWHDIDQLRIELN